MVETTNAEYAIRAATEDDVEEIYNMIMELAIYEKCPDDVKATPELLRNTLSFPSDTSKGYAKTILISPADAKDRIAGMALYFHSYSTWTAAPGIYLEDLFVRPAFRKRGYGKALLQALGRECVQLGCKRLDWSVLKWNTPSIDFYVSEAIGAKPVEGWHRMRVDGDRLEQLANRRD